MEDAELLGIHHGTVIDRVDPLVLGRVRVSIPGVIEESEWAFPVGTLGGGSAGRGFYAVPELHADVSVMFILGDPDRPVYLSGHWGTPGGTAETPSYVAALPAAEAPDVRCYETPNFIMVFDDRAGHEAMILKHKASGALTKIYANRIEFGAGASEPFLLGNVWKTMMEALIDAIVAHAHVTAVGTSSPPVNSAAFSLIKSTQLDPILSTLVFGKMAA